MSIKGIRAIFVEQFPTFHIFKNVFTHIILTSKYSRALSPSLKSLMNEKAQFKVSLLSSI